MSLKSFDHVVIPTADPEAILGFYKRLGFIALREAEWRAGKSLMFSLAFGDNKINVHPPEVWQSGRFSLRGPTAVPGCGDFCFVWDGTIEEAEVWLKDAGAEVIEGPVKRDGGRALGTGVGTSIYTRDPDGNLLEFMVY
jgi:catechol 2,3-dioxygenase-like lactoylglutathione lyase family enzyme